MSEESKPQLNLGTPPGKLKRPAVSGAGRLAWVLIGLQILTIGFLAMLMQKKANVTSGLTQTAGEDLRAIAMELEDRSLAGQSARAWEKYLDQTPDVEDRAQILYRIGKLYLQAEEYGPAAAAFVRCEQAAGEDEEIKRKVGTQFVTCLRRLGLYGEVGRELSRRVEAGGEDVGQGKVLATLAGETLTDADLDRMIEQRVDQMLAMQGATGDEQTRQMLLKQFAAPQMRERLFQELLQRELFTRRARELKLDQDEEFVRGRQALEDDLLASRFRAKELKTIQPTDVDLQAYYETHKDSYKQPESAEVVFFKLDEGEDSSEVLKDIKSADDFKKVAAKRQRTGDAGEPQQPQSETVTRGRAHPKLGDVEQLFGLETGAWTDKPHENGKDRYLVLLQSKTPAQTPPLEEVRRRVEAEYRARKEQELSQKLFQDLMARYDVRILDVPPSTGGEDEKPDKETKKTAKKAAPQEKS